MCDQHNARATVKDNTGQNADKGHTPSPRIEIKIPHPGANRTRAVELEGGILLTTPQRQTYLIILGLNYLYLPLAL